MKKDFSSGNIIRRSDPYVHYANTLVFARRVEYSMVLEGETTYTSK